MPNSSGTDLWPSAEDHRTMEEEIVPSNLQGNVDPAKGTEPSAAGESKQGLPRGILVLQRPQNLFTISEEKPLFVSQFLDAQPTVTRAHVLEFRRFAREMLAKKGKKGRDHRLAE